MASKEPIRFVLDKSTTLVLKSARNLKEPTIAELARDSKLSYKTVRRVITKLVNAGFATEDGKAGKATIYAFDMESLNALLRDVKIQYYSEG